MKPAWKPLTRDVLRARGFGQPPKKKQPGSPGDPGQQPQRPAREADPGTRTERAWVAPYD